MTERQRRARPYISGGFLAALIVLGLLSTSGHAGSQPETTGALDTSFGTGGRVTVPLGATFSSKPALLLQADGRLLAGGEAQRDFGLVRLHEDGSLDDSFGVGGRVVTDFGGGYGDLDLVQALVQQPDGALVAAGMARGGPAGADFGLARYLPDGTLDTTFGVGGLVMTDFNAYYESVTALILQPDGKLVAAGGPPFLVARYNPDGSLDETFGAGGKVTTAAGTFARAAVLQPDGKIVVGGSGAAGNDLMLVRYRADGTLDSTFGTQGLVTTDFGGSEAVVALALQPDGKLVAAGGPPLPGSSSTGPGDFLLARYLPDGSLDPSFGAGGKAATDFGFWTYDQAEAVVVQPDGRIVVGGGALATASSPERFGLARYEADGSLDETFGSSGKVVTDFAPRSAYLTALVLYPDGRLAAAGPGLALARYGPGDATCVVNTLAALQRAPAPMDPGVSAAIAAGKGSDTAVARPRPPLDPSIFRRFRDDVLTRTATGRRYAGLYAAHSREVVRLMLADAALREGILNGLLTWQPEVAVLPGARSVDLKVTPDQSRTVDTVLDRLAVVGSPSLRKAIETERRGQRRGQAFTQEVLREVIR